MSEAQEFERDWWGDCVNTYGEETKQLVYAEKMGLSARSLGGKWPVYDLAGTSVLDLGGGPVSMLLKCVNLSRATIVDPCPYPDWVGARYAEHDLGYVLAQAEGYEESGRYDECWLYNVLQHVEEPKAVIATAKRHARLLRIFEWVGMAPSPGHPHQLMPGILDQWIRLDGQRGLVEHLNDRGCVGDAYSGVFRW